ncbi:MAG: hypothetical protein ACO1OB_10460 [Archangium sp.]
MRRLFAFLAVFFVACPPEPQPDASIEFDAGFDSGVVDAGRPIRDAGADAGFTDAPVERWCELQAWASCERRQRCGQLRDAGFAGCLLDAQHAARCDQTGLTRGVREFRVQYIEVEALRCLNGYARGSCEATPDGCENVFTGLSAPDFPCLHPVDCDVSGFCDLYDAQCPHHCRAWVPRGASCDGSRNRCAPDDACDSDDGGVRTCRERPAQGAPCIDFNGCGEGAICSNGTCTRVYGELGDVCGTVNGYPLCPAEFFCSSRDGGAGTCERRAGLGGACIGPAGCLPSLRCTTLITTGTCVVKASRGEACVDSADCEDGLYCRNANQRCEPLPTDGQSCSYDDTAYRCAPGHTCAYSSTSDDTCVAWQSLGGPCSYSGQCLSNDCEYATLPDGGFGGTCVESCSRRADGGQ